MPAHVEAAATATLAEHLGEDAAHVDERVMTGRMLILAATAARLIAIEAARRRFLARAVDLARIETPTLLGIGENFVGLTDLLELGFSCLVAGIEVGVMFLGELAERLADVVLRRRSSARRGRNTDRS